MMTVIVNYCVFIFIIGMMIFISFKEFNLNEKTANITKLNVDYRLILFCSFFILIIFVFKPNVFDKIKAHDFFVKIDSKDVAQINLFRSKGIGISKRNFRIENTDSINSFINKTQNIRFHFFGGIGGGDYSWRCKIKMKDSSVFRVDFIQGKQNLLVTPYYKGRRGESYENKDLIAVLNSLRGSPVFP